MPLFFFANIGSFVSFGDNYRHSWVIYVTFLL